MLTKIDSIDISKAKLHALFVGEGGAGKTIQAASGDGPVLIFDFDGRHLPLVSYYKGKKSDIFIRKIGPSNFLSEFAQEYEALIKECPYKTVVVDSITALSNTCISAQMLMKGSFNLNEKVVGINRFTGAGSKGKGFPVPSWDEFNGEAMLITQIFEVSKEIKANTIFTAHPIKRIKILEGGAVEKYESIVSFGPKVESMIPIYFNEVWYFDTVPDQSKAPGITKRIVRTRPNSIYPRAKTALPIKDEYTITDGGRLLPMIIEDVKASMTLDGGDLA